MRTRHVVLVPATPRLQRLQTCHRRLCRRRLYRQGAITAVEVELGAQVLQPTWTGTSIPS